MKTKIYLLTVLLIGAFAGVAHNRYNKRLPIWTLQTIAYTLAAAVITLLVLTGLHLLPWR